MTSYPPLSSFPGAPIFPGAGIPYPSPYISAPIFLGGAPTGPTLPAGIVPPGTIIPGHGFPSGLATSTRTVDSALPKGLRGGAPELPGEKLTKAECIQFGVPEGAVWGRVGADNAEPEFLPENDANENEDDVRGTQV